MRAPRLLATFATVPVLALAACGDDDDATAAASARTTPTPLSITTSDAGTDRFRVEVPSSIEGGLVELEFRNASKVPHEAQLLRLEDGHTVQEAIAIRDDEDAAATPDWMRAAGGSGDVAPGKTGKVTLNLAPGRYAVIDNANPDGPSYSVRGARAEFDVTAGEDGELPASSATIVAATDAEAEPPHSFRTVDGLKVGANRLRFVNEGDELHHAVLLPILAGKTIEEVEAAFTAQRPSGPPPVDFAGVATTAVLDGGGEQVTDLVVREPGRYALVCFITNRDGKDGPHLGNGMIEEVEIE